MEGEVETEFLEIDVAVLDFKRIGFAKTVTASFEGPEITGILETEDFVA